MSLQANLPLAINALSPQAMWLSCLNTPFGGELPDRLIPFGNALQSAEGKKGKHFLEAIAKGRTATDIKTVTKTHEAILNGLAQLSSLCQPDVPLVPSEVLDITPQRGKNDIVVATISDLHYGPVYEKEVKVLANEVCQLDPDILIIAGDVVDNMNYFGPALRLFQGGWKTLVLTGNHDLWSAKTSGENIPQTTTQQQWEETLPQQVLEAGAIWLEQTVVVVPSAKLAIAGTNGWYDYSGEVLDRPLKKILAAKEFHVQDGYRMDWEWSDPEFAMTRRVWLEAALRYLSEKPGMDQVFVATHYPPFLELRRPDTLENDYFRSSTPFFYTPSLGEMIAAFPKVTHVRSGHTHIGHRATITRRGMPSIDAQVVDNFDRNQIAMDRFPVV